MVWPVDSDGSGLSEAAFVCATGGGGEGRPAEKDAFELALGWRLDSVDPATRGAGELSAADGESGAVGLYGLLRTGGTKNGLDVFASDGADDPLT